MTYSVEKVMQIWNDKHGDRFEVGPDRDSLGLVEIRSVTDDGKISSSITLPVEAAKLLVNVMPEVIYNIEKSEENLYHDKETE